MSSVGSDNDKKDIYKKTMMLQSPPFFIERIKILLNEFFFAYTPFCKHTQYSR